MERHFDEELNKVHIDLLFMSSLAEKAIVDSIKSLEKRDGELAHKVIEQDKAIDELELKISERCLTLLALRQPLASDLRYITTAMSLNGELERIADLAVDIAQRSVELSSLPLLKPLVDIPKLCLIAQKMVNDAVSAFVQHNTAIAKKVISTEPEADALRNLIQDELINDYMSKDPSTTPRAVPLLLIARHLERICDHATNIAEDVIYMVEARAIRHHHDKI